MVSMYVEIVIIQGFWFQLVKGFNNNYILKLW